MSRVLSGHGQALGALNDALLAIRIEGVEAMNQLGHYEVMLSTPGPEGGLGTVHTEADLDSMIGHLYTVTIDGDGGDAREISGLIVASELLRKEQHRVLYQIELRPWLHLAELSSNCRIFQDQTVADTLRAVLANYPFESRFELDDTYPSRDYQVQYNETDYAFFCRQCQDWGLNFYFEHTGGKQTLVITDTLRGHPPSPDARYAQLRYNPTEHRQGEERLQEFSLRHRLVSGAWASRDYDYTRAQTELGSTLNQARNTAHNQQEMFEWHENTHYSQPQAGAQHTSNNPTEEGAWFARRRLEALQAPARGAQGRGPLRGLRPGYRFALSDHPQRAANTDYLVLSTQLLVEDTSESSSTSQQGVRIETTFTAYPCTNTPHWRPERNIPKPYIHGPQTARVVGPANTPIYTDNYGRIKVEFMWDRYSERNENSSCWLRVASPFAGNQMGMVNLPRVGQEVLVEFIGGNPDLPVCALQLHNQLNMPPWQLPQQLALSGFRSRELGTTDGNGSGRSNQLIFDDTPGNIQTQLRSDHLASQLSLGHITRIEDSSGRKDPRGQGFEMRSDGHGVVRAGAGLLITTEMRPHAQAHITDSAETTKRLQTGQGQQESMAAQAQQYGAQERGSQQDLVAKALKEQNQSIAGNKTANPQAGLFPELEQPHMVLSSPAGIHIGAHHSTHIASGEHIAISSTEHTAISAKGLFASIGESIRFFVQKAGMRLIAANGDIDIKALQNNINLLAKLKISETAEQIVITGSKSIVLNGAGSYIELKQGSIELGTTQFTVHANLSVTTPKMQGLALVPDKTTGPGNLDIFHHYADKNAIANAQYTVRDVLGKLARGTLDANGFASVAGLAPGPAQVFFGEDPRNPWEDANQLKQPVWPNTKPTQIQDADPSVNTLVETANTDQSKPQKNMASAVLGSVAGSISTAGQALGSITQKASAAMAGLPSSLGSLSNLSGLSKLVPTQGLGTATAALGKLTPKLGQATALVNMAQPQSKPLAMAKTALTQMPGAVGGFKLPAISTTQ